MKKAAVFNDALAKGTRAPSGGGAVVARPLRLLAGDITLPAAVLLESRIAHNLSWMQRFVSAYGLNLAPHGKTTMAPALFRRQIEGGAWGITVATAQQALVAATNGIRRILMANQLIGAANIETIAALLADPALSFFCLVDSAAGVDAVGAVMSARGRSIDVLLELAPTADQQGYRTGVRNDAQAAATLAAVARWSPHVRLAGVELYEGVLSDEAEIRAYLRRGVATTERIAAQGGFARSPAILSGGGSAWYDLVAEEFAQVDPACAIEVVLRPGCYLSHDAGLYREAQRQILARNPVAASMQGGLRPALQVWACIQSRPDPTRAVVAMGKRDVAFDAGLPTPILQFRPWRDVAPLPASPDWRVTNLMDQHAYLDLADGDDLQVGDLIGFDISHPCLTFDKWRQLLLVDDDYNCIDVVKTFF